MKPCLHQQLLFFIATILLLILTVHSQPSSSNDLDFIRTSCNTTLYPDLCFSTLSNFSSSVHNDSILLARAAISVALYKTLDLASYLSNVTTLPQSHVNDVPHPTATAVFKDCFENLKDAVEEMRGSMKQMKELVTTGSVGSFRFQMSNVQTWLSAALTDEETCTDGFKDVQDEPRKDDVSARVDDVKKLTSNALALVNRCV